MTARVVAAQVREILSTPQDDDTLEASFIDTAHTIVDANLLSAGLNDAILTKIELYLAAHFVALTDEKGGIVRDSYGSASSTFSDVYTAGFGSTRFGQMALTLDSSGLLQALTTNKLRAELRLV